VGFAAAIFLSLIAQIYLKGFNGVFLDRGKVGE